MLPKQKRLTRKEFGVVLSSGRRFVSTHFLLYVLKHTNQTQSKFAFSVSKKIAKKAVTRNKYRRQGYSIISKHFKDISLGFSFVFVFKKAVYPISFSEMEKEIMELLFTLSHKIQ